MKRIDFTKIIKSEKVADADKLAENAKTKSHVFLYAPCEIEKGGYIILDFGKELCGRLHIEYGWNEVCGSVRIRLGESVAEVCAEIGENNAGNYHSLRDNVYSVVSWADISTSESGFRFARIDNVGDASVKPTMIFAEENENGLTIKGDFSCSDKRINEIYKTAERTLSLCVRENDIWDGVKRDRVFWMGDFYPELIGASLLYGDIPQFESVLQNVKYFDGHWVNDIPSYSAWWIICLEKYFEISGNREYVKKLIPYAENIVNEFSVIIGDKGEVSYKNSKLKFFCDNEFFIDWPTNKQKDSEIGWRYLILYTMQCVKRLYKIFGGDDTVANSIIAKLNEYEYKPSSFKQVTALGVMAGKISTDEARPLLKKGGTEGLTTFMSFAIFEAMRIIGEGEFALSMIKEYYGAMLDLGATTFWEDFDMDWLKDKPQSIDEIPGKGKKNIHADYGKFCYLGLRHSLCHGWSSGFIDFFYKHILGIILIENGYKTIKVEPHLCGLKYAEGKIPTKYGIIEVRHELKNGKTISTIKLPDGVKGI